MSKILKNTTGSDVAIADVGQTVPASSQITITPQDYLLYADSSDTVTLVGAGTLVVNDGSVDLSIADGMKLIQGIFPSSVKIITSDESPNTVTLPSQNKSAFGDIMTESVEPVSQISGVYGLNDDTETFDATGGSVGSVDGMYRCTTGTSIGGFGVIRTNRATIYREGQGLMGRFTAKFDANPVANSLQFGGLFNLTDTVAFGYRGADFGILFDTYGAPEIRQLNITTGGNGTLNLTLNGVVYNIPITNGTASHNAHEIEDYLKNNQDVWNVQGEEDSVIFQARSVGPKSGTYSVSGAGLSGTFSQIEVGETQTNKTILQADWNVNTADFLVHDKLNVYMIKVSYLGAGPIHFYVMNYTTQQYMLVHTETFAGIATKPSLSKRALKIGWVAASLGSTTALEVCGGSAGTFIEGKSKIFGSAKSIDGTNSSVGSDFVSIVSIRTKVTFQNKVMLGRIVPIGIYISNDGAKRAEFSIGKNTEFGETHYLSVGDDSIAQYAIDNNLIIGSDRFALSGVVSAGGAFYVDLKDLDIELQLEESLTVFGRKVSGTNVEMTATFVWKEDY